MFLANLSSRKFCTKFGLLFTLLFALGCEKDVVIDNSEPQKNQFSQGHSDIMLTHQDSVAIAKMPEYYQFLTVMKQSGYSFFDFKTYFETSTSLLPQKLIVIRHDIHLRDIAWAYYAYQIEKAVIGSGHSTFYIMLNDPIELAHSQSEKPYMNLIHYLEQNKVDIEPHISPVDMYINYKHPAWQKFPLDTLKRLFERNYKWEKFRSGKELLVTGRDVFDVNEMNIELMLLLPMYNKEWNKLTHLKVQGYASHGSATLMNRVINNADILDQFALLNSGFYQYDTYNSKIFHVLWYLSDNSLPNWMKDPQAIRPGRYQFLMHPYLWAVAR